MGYLMLFEMLVGLRHGGRQRREGPGAAGPELFDGALEMEPGEERAAAGDHLHPPGQGL